MILGLSGRSAGFRHETAVIRQEEADTGDLAAIQLTHCNVVFCEIHSYWELVESRSRFVSVVRIGHSEPFHVRRFEESNGEPYSCVWSGRSSCV